MTRPPDRPVARIGLFHFATNHRDPIGALTDALSKHGDIANSLIVLPEAFNNGEVYYDQACRQPLYGTDDILDHLATIAKERDIVFVAGLLEPQNNSAYLIDRGGPRLMGHKQAHCGIDNPIEVNDTCIGALICSDALAPDREWITDKVEESPCAHKVICIPASMSSGSLDSARLELRGYGNKYVILANANHPPPIGCGSFLANKAGSKLDFKCRDNVICLKTWSELDDLGA
jgi:predicted amidohydrolase